MTKVWIVEGFSAEQYESYYFTWAVFSTKEKANEAIKSMGEQPIGVNEEEYDPGYFLREPKESILDDYNGNCI